MTEELAGLLAHYPVPTLNWRVDDAGILGFEISEFNTRSHPREAGHNRGRNTAAAILRQVVVDRFLLGVKVGYPSVEEELETTEILYAIETGTVKQAVKGDDISNIVDLCKEIYTTPHIRAYIVDLVRRTPTMEGISPRSQSADVNGADEDIKGKSAYEGQTS